MKQQQQNKLQRVQRGSTLVGFVAGVLVGLGVALGVAIYVNKVPFFFVNKGQTRTPEQDAAEAEKNKNWDPNAPLYGKNPARPLSSASGSVGTALPAPAPGAAPAEAKPAKAAKAEAKTETKTEAKAGASTPAASTATPASGAGNGKAAAEASGYFVQVGAFHSAEDAESQRAKLSLQGVEARITEREQSGRTVYRVRVGPYDKKDEAEQAKQKLDAAGFESVLIRVQR